MADHSATERMARAMCANDCVDPDMMMLPGVPYMVARAHGYAIVGEPYPVWMSYVNLAIAALTAIRVPTEAMVKAASGYRIEEAATGWGAEPSDVWTAMVDAALKETPGL